MFSTIFLDFDETLFHTQEFKEDMCRVFGEYGVTREVFWRTLSPTEHDGHGTTYYDYTFEKQVKVLEGEGYHLPGIVEKLRNLLQEPYLFDGAPEFIHWIRSISDQVIILSSGSKDFQLMKICSTGIDRLVNDILIVHDHKEEVVKTFLKKDEKYLFINDNLTENKRVHEALSEVTVISRMNTVMFPEAEYRASGIPCFYTLEEIKEFIFSKCMPSDKDAMNHVSTNEK
jgi:FMN phosphatase YigB (HAD superfamily)